MEKHTCVLVLLFGWIVVICGYYVAYTNELNRSTFWILQSKQTLVRELHSSFNKSTADFLVGNNNSYCSPGESQNLEVGLMLNPLPGMAVNISGSVKCALYMLNNVIGHARETQLKRQHTFADLQTIHVQAAVKAIGSPRWSSEEYFPIIAKYPQISTVLLIWHSLRRYDMATCNLPVEHYFYSRPLHDICTMQTVTGLECSSNLNASNVFKSSLLPPYGFFEFSNKKYNSRPIPGAPDQIFLHIVHNSYLDDIGNVASGDLDMIPFQCQAKSSRRKFKTSTAHFEEVFTIAQFWGGGFYHKSIEGLPRLAPFLDFLLENPHIKVHVVKKNLPHMQLLGIGEKTSLS